MNSHKTPNPWNIHIDTGGTFTDCIAQAPDGSSHRCKVLSSSALRGTIERQIDPCTLKVTHDWNAPDHFVNGFRLRLAGMEKSDPVVENFDARESILTLNLPVEGKTEGKAFEVLSDEEAPVLAARLVTQTPRGQQLPAIKMHLSTTRGTNALLERKGAKSLFLITEGFGDLLLIGNQQRPELFALQVIKPDPFYHQILEMPERIDTIGTVLTPLDMQRLEEILSPLLPGFDSVAVCLMNSYRNPVHEKMIKTYLVKSGVKHISLSSELSPEIRIIPRAVTSDVDAYLSPIMKQYIRKVSDCIGSGELRIMTSAGSLTNARFYQPKDGLLSGPAGGVTGAAAIGRACGIEKLISFDMGGTSTDVSRYDNGFDYSREHSVRDARLSAPSLSIETVAAGGGSVCGFDGESLMVGPESAGADPGPACYGSGGPLTITDVNLLTGRLDSSNFHFPVDLDAAKDAFHYVFERVRKKRGESVTGPEILEGFLDIANEKMSQAITSVSTAKGFNPAEFTLVAFGGAGGQHVTAIASKLGIHKILVPQDAGLLSAYGLGQSRIEKIESLQCLDLLDDIEPGLPGLFKSLREKAGDNLEAEGVSRADHQVLRESLFVRFRGQESTVEIPWLPNEPVAGRFRKAYKASFGHWVEERDIEIESIRVILAGKQNAPAASTFELKKNRHSFSRLRYIDYMGSRLELPVYKREDLEPGTRLKSPALILNPFSTLFAEPGWDLKVRSDRTIEMDREENDFQGSEIPVGMREKRDEVVNLQLYTNRFTAIAEEMGEMLRRTALSVNVKERLDFSCALLDDEGYLVANAPHIPVHLGAMGICVRTLMQTLEMDEGDVILTNHPGFGGSHLPDITLVTPVFHNGKRIGFVANRAHHAEIGGKSPGSMPPDASNLEEEGVVLPPFRLIQKGKENWEQIKQYLLEAPWPTRAVEENLADLQAGVAANHRGSQKLLELVEKFGDSEVAGYMKLLKSYAAGRMRMTIQKLTDGIYRAEESLDDGSKLKVKCEVKDGQMAIDFTGSADVHPGNLNANPSIVNSVVIYVLRLLVNEPLPLNDGLLEPVKLILPTSILNPPFPGLPGDCPAVVGGNIETSQRLADTLLKAFGIAACSQGTMNNVLFGNDNFGYYETVAGGTGAGQGYHGADGVHHHMTNTRATDPEILEHRYPVRLEKFGLRKHSGGNGKWKGGSGLIREITFLEPAELSVLTQHRIVPPYGLKGGKPGRRGNQKIIRKNGSVTKLLWKDRADIETGDRFVMHTPGGGGYGPKGKNKG